MVNLKTKWYRFRKNWKQFWCSHSFNDSRLISKKKRPDIRLDNEFVYVENTRQCKKCGKYWNDNGLELHISFEKWLNRGDECQR